MGWYGKYVFPRLLDRSMADPVYEGYRRDLLADAQGSILEIGFGTGLNLGCYPTTVQSITAVDINPGMNPMAQRRIQQSGIQVDLQVLDAQHLPMPDQQFDTVVSTWTLCSIPHLALALQEIRRVLKPTGRFLFLEHGLSPVAGVQVWQRRLEPIQKVLADGCHLTRPIDRLIREQGFEIQRLNTYEAAKTPAFLGYFYQGMAIVSDPVT
ncbi:MAG: class I SAM-dependent methyltransferase [Synechococcaceae cyanobacterium RM1_1_27]|nr:class I SAM-dependent methyltransferase [Synechococcaceae cyanobacterium SM2_3_2]NJO85511.1 class I SAM-dependent methyltransferase [Synechococcaceae cyanobacterium RM1_1_27]